MLQEEDQTSKIKIQQFEEIHTLPNSKQDKLLKDTQLDFQKNYPKNIFIPMIEYLAEIGLKQQYESSVGTREDFQGKNVVSLSLIHKLMGAQWFKQNVQERVLISTISNKILMNSKIKKKLFHLYIVKNLFEIYDEDLKEFKKRISKLANSISQLTYVEDELFEFPSSILYLLRLFYKLISSNTPHTQNDHPHLNQAKIPSKYDLQDINVSSLDKTLSILQNQPQSQSNHQHTKQGSKEEYKNYIRKIINHFNSDTLKQDVSQSFQKVQRAIMERQSEVIKKYGLAEDVPSWSVFVGKVVQKCYDFLKRNGKITHAMMNEWISDFRQSITTVKQNANYQKNSKQKGQKKDGSYQFKPFILKYSPNQL